MTIDGAVRHDRASQPQMLTRRFLCCVVAVVAFGACAATSKGASPTTGLCPSPSGNTYRYLSCIVRNNPNDKYGWYDLGISAQADQHLTAAATDYQNALAIDRKFEPPLYGLGVIRLRTGDYPAAITALTLAVALKPNDASAHWNLGLALTHLHTTAGNKRAISELNKAQKLDPLAMRPAPPPAPCPAHQHTPTFNETFCGPTPLPGNGFGPSGECTGRENASPCGPGMIPGRYYAYTLPGRCDGQLILDGRAWRSDLPPTVLVPDTDVWVRIGADGRTAGFISPHGTVGFQPATGQPLSTCTTNTAPAIGTTGPGAYRGPTG